LIRDHQERIYYRIPGHKDSVWSHPFSQQVMARVLCRREVPLGKRRDKPPINLFRKGLIPVVRTQTGLYMCDRYLEIKGSQRSGER
jgi:hypothetical protein